MFTFSGMMNTPKGKMTPEEMKLDNDMFNALPYTISWRTEDGPQTSAIFPKGREQGSNGIF
jgi:hypothetical protein